MSQNHAALQLVWATTGGSLSKNSRTTLHVFLALNCVKEDNPETPCKPRVHYISALYHVMVRGNSGQNIFADDDDRCRFYFFLQEGVEKFGHRQLVQNRVVIGKGV